MKLISIFILLVALAGSINAQHIAVAADRENILYVGLENPVTITAENCPCNQLVVKTDNGFIEGSSCKYSFRGGTIGKANITVYKKAANRLSKLGVSSFRVKRLPAPVFKIGPYGEYNKNNVELRVLATQLYARADIECCGFDAKAPIDSFCVEILQIDSCRVKYYLNVTNELSEKVRTAFSLLVPNDIVVFKKIYAKGPDGSQWELDPLVLTIEK